MTENGLVYEPDFMSREERDALALWLRGLRPVWESRHSPRRGLREGQTRRRLLRPVYWLGGWQFACLNYFHPPEYVEDRVVEAEPYPPLLARLTQRIEAIARETYRGDDLPDGWRLNTCLINYYGLTLREGRWIDTARVGGHRDFEPGPTGSLSIGSPGLFQFSTKPGGPEDKNVAYEQWLANGSMLLFGTPRLKETLYHRVPRIRRRGVSEIEMNIPDFRVLRINLTLRYVPERWIVPFAKLGAEARADVQGYIEAFAERSSFFADALKASE